MNRKEIIEKYTKELGEHPAMKFANDAIVLAALRSGTKGYTGKEHLGDFIEKVVNGVIFETLENILSLQKTIDLDGLKSRFVEVLDIEKLQEEILKDNGNK